MEQELKELKEREHERFRLVGMLNKYKYRVKEAEESIKIALNTAKTPAVSFSFGKDSLVCLDIAVKLNPDILIINIDRGLGGDTREAVELYEKYAKERNLNFHRVKTPKSALDIYAKAGSFDLVDQNDVKKNRIAGINRAREEFGIDCFITGLRAEENKGRSYIRRLGKNFYSKSDEILRCNPVLNWKGDEIWAHIIKNNLPYMEWYDKHAFFYGYEESRYGNWLGQARTSHGRYLAMKMFYADEFNEVAKVFPELRKYS